MIYNYFLFSHSGADLSALIREAACIALKEFMSLSHANIHTPLLLASNDDQCVVCRRHFDEALHKVQPSVTDKVSFNQLIMYTCVINSIVMQIRIFVQKHLLIAQH